MSEDRIRAAIESVTSRQFDRRDFLRAAAYSGGAAGLATFLAACGSSTTPTNSGEPLPTASGAATASTEPGGSISPGNIEVVTFYPEGNADQAEEVMVSTQFEAMYPGSKVTLTFGGGDQTPPIMQRFLAGNPPDVPVGGQISPFIFAGNVGDSGLKYARSGQLLDLTSALQGPAPDGYGAGKWIDQIYPGLVPFLNDPVDGKIYAVPRDVIYLQVWYNKAIFEKQGVTPPATWAEFLSLCAKLKTAGVIPLALSNEKYYQGFYWDYLLYRCADPNAVYDALRGKGELKSIAGVSDAGSRLAELLKGAYFLPGFEGTDFTAAQVQFFQGKGAMLLVGSWLVGEMKGSIPPDFQLGSFHFPTVDGGLGDQTGLFANTNDYVVASASKRTDLAIEWLRVAGSKTNQNSRVKNLNYFQGYMGVDQPSGSEGVADLLKQPKAARVMYWGLLSEPQEFQDLYYNDVQKVFYGKTSTDAFVGQISDDISKYWKSHPSS